MAHKEEDRALADRLVNYADALVALAFLGTSGLGLAAADPDIRGDLVRASLGIAIANLGTGVVITAILLLLRRWEGELRVGSTATPRARSIGRNLHWARIGIVWLATLQAVGLMLAIR